MSRTHRHLETIFIFSFCVLYLLPGVTGKPALGQGNPPTFEKEKCRFDIPSGLKVQCGFLTVPENRNKQGSREIRLYVAIIKSRAGKPTPDPVVYLEGGPGGSAVMGIDAWTETPLLDQRGTGYSEPNLTCGQNSSVKHKKKSSSETR